MMEVYQMTNSQVFRWFCKEQRITHLIHRMYNKIQPCKLECEGNALKDRYLTFDEYIDDMVSAYGFPYLLDRIISAYKSKMRLGMKFNEYYTFAIQLTKKFEKFNRKWEYFVKNNIQLEESIKIGDIVKFKDWDDIREMKVTSTDFYQSLIYGNVISNNRNWDGREYTVSFGNMIDKNGKHIKQNYLIRRNKKIYHGTNSR